MSTEEDTFRKLRQTPFSELRRLLGEFANVGSLFTNTLEKHGWTPGEYESEARRRRSNMTGSTGPR